MGDSVGLRERKRLATRRSIQTAVLALIHDRSLDRVTVEEISAHANISPRTFFNYFASKEAAAVGDALELHPSLPLDHFVEGGWGSGIIDDLARLLSIAVNTIDDDVAMVVDRRRILRQYPNLLAIRMMSMLRFEDDLAGLVARRLARDAQASGAAPPSASAFSESVPAEDGAVEFADRARLITLVAFGALRHAWGRWAESDGTVPLARLIEQSFAGLADLLDAQPATVAHR